MANEPQTSRLPEALAILISERNTSRQALSMVRDSQNKERFFGPKIGNGYLADLHAQLTANIIRLEKAIALVVGTLDLPPAE